MDTLAVIETVAFWVWIFGLVWWTDRKDKKRCLTDRITSTSFQGEMIGQSVEEIILIGDHPGMTIDLVGGKTQ